MAEQLFPVFNVPAVAQKQTEGERKYKPSFAFDFEKGDFVRDGAGNLVLCSGREAYEQWCRKMASTERLAHLAYDQDQGAELIDAMARSEQAAVESDLERTVTEALKVNQATEYVRGFTFSQEEGGLVCSFTVKGHGWEEFPVEVLIKT